MGRIAERDTRLLTLSVLTGLFAGRTEEDVNLVNAPTLAEERGITVSETRETQAARLRRPDPRDAGRGRRARAASSARRSASCTARTCSRPGASASTSRSTTRTSRCSATATCPAWSAASAPASASTAINISAAAVGRQAQGEGARSDLAVMAVTTDGRVPDEVVDQIAVSDGFVSGRSIALG